MKKIVWLFGLTVALSGCGGEGKKSLEQALLDKMKSDTDISDYKLDPQQMADCMLDKITDSLPLSAAGPSRSEFFDTYARFLTTSNPGDGQKVIDDAAKLFGSVQEARKAALSITEHEMDCISTLVSMQEPAEKDREEEEDAQSGNAAPAAAPVAPAAPVK